MPSVSRSRTVRASPTDVWRIVGDVAHLARWWPLVERVEGIRRGEFTQVMRTKKGRAIRADYRVVEMDRGRVMRWEQEVEGTPFERFLALNEMAVDLEPEGEGTSVTISSKQKLRGLSRVGGGVMLKRATKKQLDEALDGLEKLL